MSEIGLDDELLVARTVQGMGLALPPMMEIPTPAGVGSAVSSIAPSSPTLEAPRENVLFKVLTAHNTTEMLSKKRTDLFEADATSRLKDIDRLSLEKEEAFRKELALAKEKDSWSTLSQVASYVTSVGAMTLAFSIGGVPGLLLGASGVVGGAVRLAHDTHLMQPILDWWTQSKELQTSIQQEIDMGAMYLQLGLGVAGGMAAWQAGSFAALDYLSQTSSILSATGATMQATSKAGTAYTNLRTQELNAHMKELDLETFLNRQVLTKQMKQTNETLDEETQELEHLRKWIEKQKVELG